MGVPWFWGWRPDPPAPRSFRSTDWALYGITGAVWGAILGMFGWGGLGLIRAS